MHMCTGKIVCVCVSRFHHSQMITLGKRGTETSRQKAWNWMREPSLVDKLFGPLRQRYADRPGGYTRVLRAPNRKGDNAPMAVVELVGNRY